MQALFLTVTVTTVVLFHREQSLCARAFSQTSRSSIRPASGVPAATASASAPGGDATVSGPVGIAVVAIRVGRGARGQEDHQQASDTAQLRRLSFEFCMDQSALIPFIRALLENP
eukprot:COSAG02_NODE_8418_length_2578_cov_186.219847_5_plen_114_part_01